MLVLYLVLEKNHFHPFLLIKKMDDTVNFEDNFLYNFSRYRTNFFLSKYVILIVSCLVLTNSLFSTILLGGLRINYSVNIETIFHIFLVFISVSFNAKPIKKRL